MTCPDLQGYTLETLRNEDLKMTIDINNFYWVAVSTWGDIYKMTAVHSSEDAASIKAKDQVVEMVNKAVIEQNGQDAIGWASVLPVALYVVEYDEINEVTLFGPQLLVRGQPTGLISLDVIKT